MASHAEQHKRESIGKIIPGKNFHKEQKINAINLNSGSLGISIDSASSGVTTNVQRLLEETMKKQTIKQLNALNKKDTKVYAESEMPKISEGSEESSIEITEDLDRKLRKNKTKRDTYDGSNHSVMYAFDSDKKKSSSKLQRFETDKEHNRRKSKKDF